MNQQLCLRLSLGLLATVALCVDASSATDFRTVTQSRAPADAGLPGAVFGFLGSPSINELGETSFSSWLIDPSTTESFESLWTESGGSGLRLVARRDTPIPDVPGFAFYNFYPDRTGFPYSVQYGVPVSNNHGVVAFRGGGLEIGSLYNSFMGAWRERQGELRTLNDSRNMVVGEAPLVNERGEVVFGTAFQNSGNGMALYQMGADDQLRLVVPGGRSPTPGGAPGDMYSISDDDSVFTPPRYTLNDAGQISFMARTYRASGMIDGNFGLWIEPSPGNIRAVVLPGEVAAGAGGARWLGVSGHGINNDGKVAFTASVRQSGINNTGVWTGHDSGDLVPLALQGQAAPGGGPLSSFGRFEYGSVVINDRGQVAFRATLESPTTSGPGLWMADGEGSVIPVAVPGMSAPGTDAVFRGADSPVLNARGQIAFTGYLSGSGVNGGNDTGIWATNDKGVLQLIARTGDVLDIDDRESVNLRIINELWFAAESGNADGRASGFNDLGQLAFMARTSTLQSLSYGIYVSNAVAIPEPSVVSLLLAGVLVRLVMGRGWALGSSRTAEQ